MTQITKERMVSVPTDKLIIPYIFKFVSPFFENFLFHIFDDCQKAFK